MTEYLNVYRVEKFVRHALEKDLQITLNRREAAALFLRCLADTCDPESQMIEMPAESYDKITAFLAQNDLQVHGNMGNTIGVYAITRQLGELRRTLRDHPLQPLSFGTLPSPPRSNPAPTTFVSRAPGSPSPTGQLGDPDPKGAPSKGWPKEDPPA